MVNLIEFVSFCRRHDHQLEAWSCYFINATKRITDPFIFLHVHDIMLILINHDNQWKLEG